MTQATTEDDRRAADRHAEELGRHGISEYLHGGLFRPTRHLNDELIVDGQEKRIAPRHPEDGAGQDTRDAARLADYIRESHPDYLADGTPVHACKEAFEKLENELPHLDEDRRKHYAGLIRFAVHNELKHYSNTEHVLSPDNDYELIIDTVDYDNEDDLASRGQDENREQWKRLANTACLAAVNENIHAGHRLREAA